MSEEQEKNEAGTPETETQPTAPEGAAAQAPQQTITVDDASAHASYSNFCRVSSTPEELILDLGLNPQPYGTGNTTIRVSQRVIMNHFTAKRLLAALTQALQRHEAAFGVLEIDVRKRVKGNA